MDFVIRGWYPPVGGFYQLVSVFYPPILKRITSFFKSINLCHSGCSLIGTFGVVICQLLLNINQVCLYSRLFAGFINQFLRFINQN
ncbi:hypothetical protein GWK91_09700 [Virgibacillus sp. MSP4-1]|uniref:hypothetical protein n=1 Tax=Virgibacillus sp. MSP4-1 TaxID=2700081 RepID=UPI00137C305C|nr:hypothetical protein [Virgibacillus sp. MSP4-1]QHS23206.1 hypothetical protein GWK91_09700 [Virgibacillus sp. MSP4-1]